MPRELVRPAIFDHKWGINGGMYYPAKKQSLLCMASKISHGLWEFALYQKRELRSEPASTTNASKLKSRLRSLNPTVNKKSCLTKVIQVLVIYVIIEHQTIKSSLVVYITPQISEGSLIHLSHFDSGGTKMPRSSARPSKSPKSLVSSPGHPAGSRRHRCRRMSPRKVKRPRAELAASSKGKRAYSHVMWWSNSNSRVVYQRIMVLVSVSQVPVGMI